MEVTQYRLLGAAVQRNHLTCDNLKTHAHRQGRLDTGIAGTCITRPAFLLLCFGIQERDVLVPSILTLVRGVEIGSPSSNFPDRGQLSDIANTCSPFAVYLHRILTHRK